MGIYSENIYKSLLEAARKSKLGKKIEGGVDLLEEFIPLQYSGSYIKVNENPFPNQELDKYFEEHSDLRMVVVQRSKVLRSRPYFKNWSCTVSFVFNEEVISKEELIASLEVAGSLVGLCEYRPRLGKFTVELLEQ